MLIAPTHRSYSAAGGRLCSTMTAVSMQWETYGSPVLRTCKWTWAHTRHIACIVLARTDANNTDCTGVAAMQDRVLVGGSYCGTKQAASVPCEHAHLPCMGMCSKLHSCQHPLISEEAAAGHIHSVVDQPLLQK